MPSVDFTVSCPGAEQLGDQVLALEDGVELRGATWIDESPVWYGKRGALVVFEHERDWLTLDRRHEQGHQTAITKLEIYQNRLISASEDNDIRLWSISKGQITCEGLWRGHNDRVNTSSSSDLKARWSLQRLLQNQCGARPNRVSLWTPKSTSFISYQVT